MNIGRKIAVRVSVWALPRIGETDLRAALEKAFRHRNAAWRTGVVEEAQARLAQRTR